MALYQGRALKARTPSPRAPVGRLGRILRMLVAIATVTGIMHLPWEGLRKRFLVLTDIRVEGLCYLDAGRAGEIAGIRRGQDLLALDCERVRQTLLLHPRIESARVTRMWPRGVRLRLVERTPVMLVRHGLPWEVDSSGVLLAPLADGVVADVPLLAGVSFEGLPGGTRLRVPPVLRGLAWVRALSESDIQLSGQVSEVDVADDLTTGLLLMEGTRVLTPAWPPEKRTLSALRVVLADLKRRGTIAREVDLRFRNQVIVRPAEPHETPAARVAMDVTGGEAEPLRQKTQDRRN